MSTVLFIVGLRYDFQLELSLISHINLILPRRPPLTPIIILSCFFLWLIVQRILIWILVLHEERYVCTGLMKHIILKLTELLVREDLMHEVIHGVKPKLILMHSIV
jgi:hypothetical protein